MAHSEDEWFEREQLHFAAGDGDLDRVKELVAQGYDVNRFDEDLCLTPLHHAVRGEYSEVSRFLLENGADVNAHDEKQIGNTPLGDVAATCSYQMAELLVLSGADPTIPGWMRLTALDRAKERKDDEGRKVYELLKRTAKTKYGHAP